MECELNGLVREMELYWKFGTASRNWTLQKNKW